MNHVLFQTERPISEKKKKKQKKPWINDIHVPAEGGRQHVK